jgi:hypothetical protein
MVNITDMFGPITSLFTVKDYMFQNGGHFTIPEELYNNLTNLTARI